MPLTKKARLIGILKVKEGADIAALSETLCRQPHTTRAALSGLRKTGYEITRETPKTDGPARYRIKVRPAANAAE